MVLGTEVRVKIENGGSSFTAFACQAPKCKLLYHISRGYFEVSDGAFLLVDKGRQPCPDDGSPMYLADLDPERGEITYRCSQFGCDGKQTVPRP